MAIPQFIRLLKEWAILWWMVQLNCDAAGPTRPVDNMPPNRAYLRLVHY